MTKAEIEWAKQHDWFIKESPDGLGVQVKDNSFEDGWIEIRNYQKLKAWAGY